MKSVPVSPCRPRVSVFGRCSRHAPASYEGLWLARSKTNRACGWLRVRALRGAHEARRRVALVDVRVRADHHARDEQGEEPDADAGVDG